jgi:hypothetical protein
VWEKAEGQGMCVLGSKGCVCRDAKGGRAQREEERVRRECRERKCVGDEKGKGCVCWEARDVCVLGSHEGRARERRRQGMCVGVGQGLGRGAKN